MTQTLTIKQRLADYNRFIRMHRHVKNKETQTMVDIIAWECKAQKIKPVKSAHISFTWYVKNKLMDKDNIAFAKKFVLDGLQRAGVLSNDGWGEILSLHDEFEIADFYGVKVEIGEV